MVMLPGTKPNGSQPSAISAVSFTFASVPVPSQIGSFGFVCRIDFRVFSSKSSSSPVATPAIFSAPRSAVSKPWKTGVGL